LGANARRGRGKSQLAGYPSSYHTSIVFRRPSRLFHLQVSIFYELGANTRWGQGRSRLAGYPSSYHMFIVLAEGGEPPRPSRLFYLQVSIFYEYALFGADARWGRGRSRLAGYPSFYHTSIVFGELTRSSRLFYLQVSIFYEYALLGANACQGRGRSWLAGYPSLVLSHIHRVFYIYRFIFSTSMPSWGLTLAEDEGDPGLPGIPHPITSLLHWPRAGNQQAPTQPLDGASGYLSGPVIFPFISVRLMGSPMSGWHQTLVNKSATARLGQYALVFSP